MLQISLLVFFFRIVENCAVEFVCYLVSCSPSLPKINLSVYVMAFMFFLFPFPFFLFVLLPPFLSNRDLLEKAVYVTDVMQLSIKSNRLLDGCSLDSSRDKQHALRYIAFLSYVCLFIWEALPLQRETLLVTAVYLL